jgi:hypothetical protein
VEFADLGPWLTLAGVSATLGAVTAGSFTLVNTALSGWQQRNRQTVDQAGLKTRQENDQRGLQEHQKIDLEGQRERQKLDLEGQLQRQKSEHAHQRSTLRQAAHFAAREDAASLVGDVMSWINREIYDKHGLDHDMFPAELPASPHASASSALKDLRKLQATHPTKAVREQIAILADKIEGGYNSIADDGSGMHEPSEDNFFSWRADVLVIIELINEALPDGK